MIWQFPYHFSMLCLRCHNETFSIKLDAMIEQEFKGQTVRVNSPVMACDKCGWITIGDGQVAELFRLTKEAYADTFLKLGGGPTPIYRQQFNGLKVLRE